MKTYKYHSTKTYGNDVGLSAVFRQWRATHSHCSKLHGYSLGFKIVFGANELDERNWVWDFGNCKEIKNFLQRSFDHKLAVARDDPAFDIFWQLDQSKHDIADIIVLDSVGCEQFAKYVYDWVNEYVSRESNGRVGVVSVECFEHGANSATYLGE